MIKLPWRATDFAVKMNGAGGNIEAPEEPKEFPSGHSAEGDKDSDTDAVLTGRASSLNAKTDSVNNDPEMYDRICGYEVVNTELLQHCVFMVTFVANTALKSIVCWLKSSE